MNRKIFLIIAVLVNLFISDISIAQADTQIVILSEKVGKIIDRTERDNYRLFPKYSGFYSAYFYRDSLEKFYCKLVYVKNNMYKDTLFSVGYGLLRNIAFRIDNIESIKRGIVDASDWEPKIKISSNNMELLLTDSTQIFNRNKNQITDKRKVKRKVNELPLANFEGDPKKLLSSDWSTGASAGISFNTIKAKGLNKILNNIENQIFTSDQYVPKKNFEDLPPTILCFSFYLIYRNKYQVDIALNKSLIPSEDNNLEIYSVKLKYNLKLNNFIKTFLSLGLASARFNKKKSYDGLYSEIGSIDYITMSGASSGPEFGLGILLYSSKSIQFKLDVNYLLLSPMEKVKDPYISSYSGNYSTNISFDTASNVNLSGFVVNISFNY